MPYLQLRDARYPLTVGENRISQSPEADIRIPEVSATDASAVAVISLSRGGAATVHRPVAHGAVMLNGVPVGAEPSPLLHGDRLSLGGCELHYADEALLGDTVEVPAVADGPPAKPGSTAGDSRSAGRLVSLVDGREYSVPTTGLTIGRDVSCDVVLVDPSVSRNHATIHATPQGYRITDNSTNGVFVNGARVVSELPLGRGDTVRVGTDEFRFYALPIVAQGQLDLAAVPGLQKTMAFPALKRPEVSDALVPAAGEGSKPVLAVLEITNEGPSKGTRLNISSPLAHVGRAAHNDVVIVDESVSETHAKLQRRDDTWYLMDLDSTNGTYAGGGRLLTEFRLTPGCDVRFGGVKTVFRPLAGTEQLSGSTRVIAGIKAPDPRRASQRTPLFTQLQEEEQPTASGSRFPLLLLAAALGIAVYMFLRGGLR
jgi:pSer/pThr/pTyr-binding forkhead associated (FHA) protein